MTKSGCLYAWQLSKLYSCQVRDFSALFNALKITLNKRNILWL